jgi:hypothetical protein
MINLAAICKNRDGVQHSFSKLNDRSGKRHAGYPDRWNQLGCARRRCAAKMGVGTGTVQRIKAAFGHLNIATTLIAARSVPASIWPS